MNPMRIPPTTYFLRAEVLRVIDGDTIEVHVYVTPTIVFQNMHVRLKSPYGYFDAPEKSTPEGKIAAEFLNSIVPPRSWFTLVIDAKRARDSFGRILACVKDEDGDDLASEMAKAGHIKKKPAFE